MKTKSWILKEGEDSDFAMANLFFIVISILFGLVYSLIYGNIVTSGNGPIPIYWSSPIYIQSFFTSLFALYLLERKNFVRISRFWFLFLPGINIIASMLVTFKIFFSWIIEKTKGYIESYAEASGNEVNEMLRDILATTEKTNANIKHMKIDSDVESDKLVKQIAATHQELLRALM